MSRALLDAQSRQIREIKLEDADGRPLGAVWIRSLSAGDTRNTLTVDEDDPNSRYEVLIDLLARGIVEEDGSPSYSLPADRELIEAIPSAIAFTVAREIRIFSGLLDRPPDAADTDPTEA